MKKEGACPRIAIFHNYMDNIGGAEMVVLTLARELGADVYSPAVNQDNIKKMGFDIEVTVVGDGTLPLNAPARQQSALRALRRLDISKQYDFFIIAGDWAISAAVNHKPNLWYVHSPIREIWDLYEYAREHIVPEGLIPNLNRYLFDVWVHYNRFLNRMYVHHAERIICNSENTRQRVKKYLKRDGAVIYPPVDTEKFYFKRTGEYWLSVNRLLKHKNVDIQVNAFKELPAEKLVIVGTYEKAEHFTEYKKYIEGIKPDNVTLLSHVDFDTLRELYANCKGFITTARDEDFGLTAVEAMASGKPVIAPNEGGYKETILDGMTGKLIDGMDANKLAAAVHEISKNPLRYKDDSMRRARTFDTQVFVEGIKREIERQI